MNKSIADRIREAQSLLSSQRVADATRLIQTTLSAVRLGSVTGEDRGSPRARRTGPTIDVTPGEGGTGVRDERPFVPGAPPQGGPGGSPVSLSGLFSRLPGMSRSGAGLPGSSPFARKGRAVALPEGALFLEREHSSAFGSRSYKLYVPAKPAVGKRPILVMLHGCTQDPDDFAAGTRMNALAEEAGALVLYPRQSAATNQSKCWNWFLPAHQERGGGEPAIIADMVAAVAAEFDGDESRVFAAGLSAGGAMAAILGAAYPDVFAAVGVHSGLPKGSARDVMSALQAMRAGAPGRQARPGAQPCRTIVFHGDRDTTVHPANGDRVASVATDGRRPCVKQGAAGGRNYRRTTLAEAAGKPAVEYWQVEGLAHAWSGGSGEGTYADPAGPDASREMLRFFLGSPAA